MLKRWFDFLFGVPLIWILSLFSRKSTSSIPDPKRILVVKLAAVGDTILLAPALRALREAYPNATIDWLVSPINQEIARTVDGVDHIIIWKASAGSIFKLTRELRKRRFDVVIDFEQWARATALVSFLTGAPVRVGFKTPGQHRDRLFTHVYEKKFLNHEVFDFLDLLSHFPGVKPDSRLELRETEEGKREKAFYFAKSNSTAGQRYVLIHPGCGADGLPREWPLANYAVVGHWLQKQFNAAVVLTSGPEEFRKTANLNKLLGGSAIDLGGKLSWSGLVSVVRSMDLVMSGNTGVMHIAAAFQKPQIALHGPTDPKLWGPLNPNAETLSSRCPLCPSLKLGFEYHHHGPNCMKQIDIEDVKNAIMRLFDKKEKI